MATRSVALCFAERAPFSRSRSVFPHPLQCFAKRAILCSSCGRQGKQHVIYCVCPFYRHTLLTKSFVVRSVFLSKKAREMRYVSRSM